LNPTSQGIGRIANHFDALIVSGVRRHWQAIST